MKTLCRMSVSSDRRGMSRTSLLAGLVLWGAVFGVLSYMYLRGQNVVDVPDSAENGTGESTAPIIVDKTNPDKASASTANISFPANPLPDFQLQNTEGGTLSLDDLKGKRWVASFVFSRCASTCPMITGAMMDLHNRVKGKADGVMFITITVDPKYDTAEVFQKYAENYRQGDSSRWKFLTGSQQEIYELIVNGFGLVVFENMGEKRVSGFEVAHTNRVVLVNEDSIPVGTFLGTRDEDMVKLRRILTGKSDFPKPGPPLAGTSPNAAPLGLSYELVPKGDDDGSDAKEAAADQRPDVPANDDSPEDGNEESKDDSAGSDEAADSKKKSDEATADEDSQAFYGSLGRSYLLTRAPVVQDESASAEVNSGDEDAEPVAGGSANNESADTRSGGLSDDKAAESNQAKPNQTVAEFNQEITRKLPGWAQKLPTLNAALNSVATVLLLFGYVAIRNKKKLLHRNLMVSAFIVSAVFLISYLGYHYALGKYTGEHGRRFEGTGLWASIYPWVLWPHVILAVFVPVLGIRVFQLAFREDWDRHRGLARITFPIWLYVSVTGVVIYGMLYHWPSA